MKVLRKGPPKSATYYLASCHNLTCKSLFLFEKQELIVDKSECSEHDWSDRTKYNFKCEVCGNTDNFNKGANNDREHTFVTLAPDTALLAALIYST